MTKLLPGVVASGISGHLWAPVGAYEQIASTTVPAGGTSTITFSGIPLTYSNLQIRGIGRTARALAEDGLYFRFNGDSASNYTAHSLFGNGTTASSFVGGTTSDTEIETYNMPGNSSASNIFGVSIIDILDYSSSNKYKTIKVFGGFDNNSTNGRVSLASGFWRNTDQISSITLIAGNSTWLEYSSFSLYGVN